MMVNKNQRTKKITQKKNCNCTNLHGAGVDKLKPWKSINDILNGDVHSVYKTIIVKNKDTQSSKKPVSYPILSKSQRNKKSGNKSIISLYRKHKKKLSRNEKRIRHSNRSRSTSLRESKINPLVHRFGTGDLYAGEQYNAAARLQKYGTNKKSEIDKISLKERILCTCKIGKFVNKIPENENENGYTDQSKKSTKEKHECKCKDEKTMTSKKFAENKNRFDKLKANDEVHRITAERSKLKVNNNKISNVGNGDQALRNVTLNAGDQTGEPFFEMKVNKQNMRVINADEIKYKVKSFGRRSFICPTRRDVCRKGICEIAKKNKHTNFDCSCKINKSAKNGRIECCDQNCDSNGIFKRLTKGFCSQSTIESKPLFEVKLDSGNMNIVNAAEIIDIFQRSNYGVCPNGICQKHNRTNCRCIRKKIIPKPMGCTDKTCKPWRKCKLAYLCSRVFSKCENSDVTDVLRYRRDRRLSEEVHDSREKRKKRKAKSRSEIIRKRNGLNIKLSRGHVWKGADRTKLRLDMPEINKDDNVMKGEKKKNKEKEPEGNIQNVFHAIYHKRNTSYFSKFVVHCLKRKRKHCVKRLKEEEKALDKADKIAMKENLKTLNNQKLLNKEEIAQWNFLTKFIVGSLNLIVFTIRNVISAILSLIFSPIRSLIYIKRRINDPEGSLARFISWIRRTWGHRSNFIARKIKNVGAFNIIADQFEDTNIYDAFFADKGRTKEEKALYESKRRKRKQRMTKRDREARFGCRHILLTTLRKTPCICCYYMCPDLYPACLSLINFMKNFFNVMIYLLAFICWTPCIIWFEVCRAFVCCLFCTG